MVTRNRAGEGARRDEIAAVVLIVENRAIVFEGARRRSKSLRCSRTRSAGRRFPLLGYAGVIAPPPTVVTFVVGRGHPPVGGTHARGRILGETLAWRLLLGVVQTLSLYDQI